MQFEHPHGFRPQVRELLAGRMARGVARLAAAGRRPDRLRPARCPVARGRRPLPSGHLRASAATRRRRRPRAHRRGRRRRRPRRARRAGGRRRRGRGDDRADLVIDAGGRLAPIGLGPDRSRRRHRHVVRDPHLPSPPRCGVRADDQPRGLGGRVRRLPGVRVPPRGTATSRSVFIRPTADVDLGLLRRRDAFDAACRAIPGLSEWTAPGRRRADQRRDGGRPAAQRVPPAARAPGAGGARRRGGHDGANRGARRGDGQHADRRAAAAARRWRRPGQGGGSRSGRGATRGSDRGCRTTSTSTPRPCGPGRAPTSTSPDR